MRQCYEEEYKYTTMTLKLCKTMTYQVQQRVYRMTTAKENGEPSVYDASEELVRKSGLALMTDFVKEQSSANNTRVWSHYL